MGLIWVSLVALPLVDGLSTGTVPLHPVEPTGREREIEYDDGFPPQACAEEEKWAMDKFEVTDGEHFNFSQKPWIVFRGATFRSSAELQEKAFCSFSRHVMAPLKKTYALSSVHVHLCVRPHKDNNHILKSAEKYFGVARDDVSLREVSQTEQSTQTGQYKTCLEDVPNDAAFVLILRPDLIFQESLNFGRVVSPDRFYFQWNLFQHCKSKEVPDQIHLVGGNMIKEFKDKWHNRHYHGGTMGAVQPAQVHYDTFHMMYRWARDAFGVERLGYLNEYPKENCHYPSPSHWHMSGMCRQRGNAGNYDPGSVAEHGGVVKKTLTGRKNLTNPLFTYTRSGDADSGPSCEWD